MFPPNVSSRPESRTASVLGIPLSLIGFELGVAGGQSYASLEVQRKFFAESTQLPLLKYICRVLTREVMREFVPVGSFKVDESTIRALQEDKAAVYERALSAFKSSAINNHQYARMVGLPEPDGQPVRLLAINVTVVPEVEFLSGLGEAATVEPAPTPDARAGD